MMTNMEKRSKDNPIIFGFIGRQGSGKDTAASMLSDMHNEFKEGGTISAYFAFADVLKNMANSTLGISHKESEFLKRSPDICIANGMALRPFWNQYGDVLKARFGETIFTNMTIDRMEDNFNSINPDLLLVTDVRLPMEVQALKNLGEKLGLDAIHIKMVNTKLPPLEDDAHETEFETENLPYDYLIEADSPEEIKIKLKEIYNAIYTSK